MNKSGIVPIGYKVLLQMQEAIKEKTKGGIIIPDSVKEREDAASQIGIILDYGPAAFTIGTGDLPNEWNVKPEIGAKVLLNKYSGITVHGTDGNEYRIISDKEILSILI
jgi:co-chaperonin GroES (HSP10)